MIESEERLIDLQIDADQHTMAYVTDESTDLPTDLSVLPTFQASVSQSDALELEFELPKSPRSSWTLALIWSSLKQQNS